MLVGEATLGDEHLRRYLRFVRLDTSSAIAGDAATAAGRRWFLNYRKGPLALYALGEYIG